MSLETKGFEAQGNGADGVASRDQWTNAGTGQQQAQVPPAGYPGAPVGYPGAPPPAQPVYYAAAPVPATYTPPPTMTIQQALSPEEIKKIRKMTWINFGCTMLQLGCSLAVIIVLTQYLEGSKWVTGVPFPEYYCYFSANNSSTPCRYAYSVASVSIFWGFILSLIQCLTLDCCGMGRLFEMVFDLLATAWWVAGAITLTTYHSEAAAAGVPGGSARQAIIALCWITAFVFLCLAAANAVLLKKYGKAYKNIKAQMAAAQQQMPVGQPMHVVQMAPPHAGYQPQVPPAGYTPAAPGYGYPPAAGPGGYPMPPQQQGVAPPPGGYPVPPQQQGVAPPPGGYPMPPQQQGVAPPPGGYPMPQ